MSTSPLAPLRNPDFRWFWTAKLVDNAGSFMAPIALAFAVLHVSNSPSALGLVLAANSIPLVAFLLFGGVIADRLPRLLILRYGNLGAALTQGTVAFLVISGHAQLWMLIVLEALNGILQATVFPALQGVLPQLVDKWELQEANLLMSLSQGALRVVSPAIAALLVVSVGPGWAVAVDALSWVAAAALLLRVRLPEREPRTGSTSVLGDLRDGWALFTGKTWLWVVVLAFGVLNAIQSGAWGTLGPQHAKATIGAGGWGWVVSADAAGALVMTVLLMQRRLERPLFTGLLWVALFGLPILAFGLTDSLPVLLVCSVLGGMGIQVFSLGWTLAMQENIAEDQLSRAYSYDALGSFVAMPIGQLAAGGLAVAFGISHVIAYSGAAYVVVALLPLASASVRRLGRVSMAAAS
ncbi:MAG: major facilitator superfamily 1 [Marmoricola sp.]|nr:major facilitator superfamily 1 [Marmoricola sp.]